MAEQPAQPAPDPQAPPTEVVAARESDATPASDPTPETPAFDYESVKGSLASLPRDVAARLLDEVEPLKAERDTHAQRAQAQNTENLRRKWEKERQEQAQRDAELADLRQKRDRQFELVRKWRQEGDYDAGQELLGDLAPLFEKEQLKQDEELAKHFRGVLRDDPEVAAYYAQTLGQQISAGIVADVERHPELAAMPDAERRALLDQPDGPALVEALRKHFTRGLISTKDAESMANAAKQATLDAVRGGSRQPDTGPNAVTPSGDGLTRAAIRGMSQAEKIARAADIFSAYERGSLRA